MSRPNTIDNDNKWKLMGAKTRINFKQGQNVDLLIASTISSYTEILLLTFSYPVFFPNHTWTCKPLATQLTQSYIRFFQTI